jgi:hypothetical protein
MPDAWAGITDDRAVKISDPPVLTFDPKIGYSGPPCSGRSLNHEKREEMTMAKSSDWLHSLIIAHYPLNELLPAYAVNIHKFCRRALNAKEKRYGYFWKNRTSQRNDYCEEGKRRSSCGEGAS